MEQIIREYNNNMPEIKEQLITPEQQINNKEPAKDDSKDEYIIALRVEFMEKRLENEKEKYLLEQVTQKTLDEFNSLYRNLESAF